MACELVNEATGGAPLSTNDYNAQNINRQALLYRFMSDQLHLTQWNTLTVPKIRLGTYIQHGGALFVVNDANEDITDPGGLANGRIYIKATRTGDVLTFEFVDSAAGYSWNYIYCGFYHADGTQLLPYVLYLTAGGDWYKFDLSKSFDKFIITATIEFTETINIGDWNMQGNSEVVVVHGLSDFWKYVKEICVIVRRDDDARYHDLSGFDSQNIYDSGGVNYFDNTNIDLWHNGEALMFANADYNATSYNRGWVTFRIQI